MPGSSKWLMMVSLAAAAGAFDVDEDVPMSTTQAELRRLADEGGPFELFLKLLATAAGAIGAGCPALPAATIEVRPHEGVLLTWVVETELTIKTWPASGVDGLAWRVWDRQFKFEGPAEDGIDELVAYLSYWLSVQTRLLAPTGRACAYSPEPQNLPYRDEDGPSVFASVAESIDDFNSTSAYVGPRGTPSALERKKALKKRKQAKAARKRNR